MSLFLKIFLWFWMTMAAIVIAVAVVTATAPPEELNPPQRELISSAMEIQAERATEIYEESGAEKLRGYLRRAGRRSGSLLYLFGPSGKEVLGHHPPSAVLHIRSRVLKQEKPEAEVEMAATDVLVAHSAQGKKGKYVFVGMQQHALLRIAKFGAAATSLRTRVLRLVTILLVTGLVCYGLARHLAAPAVVLRKATRALADGNLGVRVAPRFRRRRDELAALARDFDAMAERIESLVGNQRRLLSDISHELRSPLARLQVALSLAERNLDNKDEAKIRENLERITTESERLEKLIAQLLSLTRLENAAVQRESIDLREMAASVAADADYEAQASGKHVTLQAYDGDDYTLNADRELLRSALENVVRNAVRHTADGTTVSVSLKRDSDVLKVSVCDQGPGVAEEELTRLFEPFYRADAARVHSGGAGLGLAITQRAVEAHGGTVAARNLDGGGLCVEIGLPVTVAKGSQ